MQIFLLILVAVFLAILFLQSYLKLTNDAEAGPAELTPSEWWKHTAVEILLNVVLYIALCMKLDINAIMSAASTVAGSVGTFTEVTSIGGAMGTALLIYKTVQFTLLPLWNKLTGAKTARKKLREKVASKI